MTIQKITALEVLDSRGNPTVEAQIILEDGTTGHALAPLGVSTGENEVVELRDEKSDRYGGKGVRQAVKNITDIISPELSGRSVLNQPGSGCRSERIAKFNRLLRIEKELENESAFIGRKAFK